MTAPREMATAYNPADHEGRVRARWDDAGAFHADPARVLSGEKPPYCVLIPPPNVTGALHLGHALNNTLQDILVRVHRMRGFETLWMPGTDHAGIATQTVVEKRILAEGGRPRAQWDREAFVAKVRQWKDEYEARITEQLKLMGCSCDWARQRFTMDEVCARAVREAFFRLFRAGLIERGKRLVNWDPVTQTALADDEVEMRQVEGAFYYLRYPLCDAEGEPATASLPDGSTIDHVTVATTRPETYLGDTAVAVNPKDPRAGALRGLCVRLPIVERVIPIIEDAYVVLPDPDGDAKARYATGFLKVTPAHDENDYLIGQRHGLPMINVLAPDATISDRHGWDDVGGATVFVGLSREEARERVVEAFESRGLLEEVRRPYVHAVGHSYRSHAPIEPYLSDQWYVKVTKAPETGGPPLAALAQRAISADQRATAGGTGVSPVIDSETASGTGVSPVDDRATIGGTGVSPVIGRDLVIHERSLPHWQRGGSVYFVTFRTSAGELGPDERDAVAQACAHWHGQRADIHLFTVMPDHVHLLIQPKEKAPGEWWPLQELIHSIKSYSSHAINAARGTTGSLWQSEYYDRIVRDEEEYAEKWRYISQNPVTAGLAAEPGSYPWTRSPSREHDGRDARPTGSQKGRDARPTGSQKGRDARPTGSELPGDGEVAFHPARYAKTYEDWHENIRDWCISRQLWWGHRIPVWSRARPSDPGPDGADTLERLAQSDPRVCVRRSDAQIHVALLDDAPEIVSDIESAGFERDPDVLDTWFSSALWPLSTMGWPDPGQDPQFAGLLDAFKPTSVLCTARDIITLWVSRMVMFNRFFEDGRVPFREVYIHPVIQDGDGKRMSKSAGNGVDPLDIIRTHGADAMRFTLCGMASQTQDVRLPVERDEATGVNTSPKFDLGKRFCNKLWNASRFTIGMLGQQADAPAGPVSRCDLAPIDRWMLSRLARAAARIDAALAAYEFNVYADAAYDLLWTEFCDVYLEAIKPTVQSSPSQRACLATVFESILRLLHPALPFVTEAIHEHARRSPGVPGVEGVTLGDAGALLCLAPWPRFDAGLIDAALETSTAEMLALVRLIREARQSAGVSPKRAATLHAPADLAREIAGFAGLVERLANLSGVTADEPAGPAVTIAHGARELRLSGLVEQADAGAERQRLEKALAELDAAISTLEKRLANPGYTEKAPAALVQQTRDQLAAKRAEREAVAASLEALV